MPHADSTLSTARRYVFAYVAWLIACGLAYAALQPFLAWSHYDERTHPGVFLSGLGPALLGFCVALGLGLVSGLALTLRLGLGWRVVGIEIVVVVLAYVIGHDLSGWVPVAAMVAAPAIAVFATRHNP